MCIVWKLAYLIMTSMLIIPISACCSSELRSSITSYSGVQFLLMKVQQVPTQTCSTCYYSELRSAIAIQQECNILSSKVICVL